VQRIPSLNGLRAISIVLVLFDHLVRENHVFDSISNVVVIKPFINFISNGPLGVNVFFVISGFLITSLLLNEEKTNANVSLKNFYARRSLRIFPAYFFMLLVYFVLQSFNIIFIPLESWVTAITFTKYFNWKVEWYTAHAWSLSVEEQFYLFWPFLFILGNKIRKQSAILLVCVVPLIRILVEFYPTKGFDELSFFTRIDAIAVGCLCALYNEEIIVALKANWQKIFFGSLLLLFSIRYIKLSFDNLGLGYLFVPFGVSHGSIANGLIALIMMYSIYGPQKQWYRFLNWSAMGFLGTLSYSIYLWQQFFICETTYWINMFPQNIMFVFFAALTSYYLIETPFLMLKSRISKK